MCDFGRAWVAVECDEGGASHKETPGKYETIYRELAERPGLLLRVNPDRMFSRQHHPGQGLMYDANERFCPMMEQVASAVRGLMERAMGDEDLVHPYMKKMIFF